MDNIPCVRRSLEEYLALPETTQRTEYHDGEITALAQSDIVWLRPGSLCLVEEKLLRGTPDLVVEVLSPDSVRRDRGMKFSLYQQAGDYGHGEMLMSPLLGVIPLGDLFAQQP